MNKGQPGSFRTKLAAQAYMSIYQACTSWISRAELDRRGQRYAAQTLSPALARWASFLTLNAYRQGWHDKARKRPCRP